MHGHRGVLTGFGVQCGLPTCLAPIPFRGSDPLEHWEHGKGHRYENQIWTQDTHRTDTAGQTSPGQARLGQVPQPSTRWVWQTHCREQPRCAPRVSSVSHKRRAGPGERGLQGGNFAQDENACDRRGKRKTGGGVRVREAFLLCFKKIGFIF